MNECLQVTVIHFFLCKEQNMIFILGFHWGTQDVLSNCFLVALSISPVRGSLSDSMSVPSRERNHCGTNTLAWAVFRTWPRYSEWWVCSSAIIWNFRIHLNHCIFCTVKATLSERSLCWIFPLLFSVDLEGEGSKKTRPLAWGQ